MRFLLNMNVPRDLGERLAVAGHSYRHAGDIGLAQANDGAIVSEAAARGEVIVTHDLDYGHLLAFSGASGPSVITIRLHNAAAAHVAVRILDGWKQIEGPLQEGAIVTLEDAAFRVRRLPIE
jgi:predicted nuclease of predicted toxin-antitoxin system